MKFFIIFGIWPIAALLISSSSTSVVPGENHDANNIDKNVYLAYFLSNLNDPKFLTLESHQKPSHIDKIVWKAWTKLNLKEKQIFVSQLKKLSVGA